VEEHPHLPCHLRADLAKEVMLLVRADQESGGESIAASNFGLLGGAGKPHPVADPAPLFFVEGNCLEEGFHLLRGGPNDGESDPSAIILHCPPAQKVFAEGVDIGIEEEAEEIMALFREGPQAIGGTGGTAEMHQDPHA